MIVENVPPHRLAFPRDLRAWRQWQESTRPVRLAATRVRAGLRASPLPLAGHHADAVGEPLWLTWRGEHPAVLLALDAQTPTQLASVLRPLAWLAGTDAAVVSTEPVTGALAARGEDPGLWRSVRVPAAAPRPDVLDGLRAVLSVGAYLPAGAAAHRWALSTGASSAVVQHGLLTPFAPPLPEDCLLLAFSEQDAAFLAWQRPDVAVRVVGSQLLWSAARPELRAPAAAAEHRPVFLGQLHGAELPRRDVARAARHFCTVTGAVYRPHPGERDKLSRAQHTAWRAKGLTVDRAGAALPAVDAPVASVFSTGVLEAAARGLPARVTHPAPPRWLEAFWERYAMARWDGTAAGAGSATGRAPATPPPEVPRTESARAVARILAEAAGGVVDQQNPEPQEAP
ncbi:RNA-binding protein [Kocuria sp.]|uniref:RNA-binding protein n=1 Tax=Kocuria sp. TaxID=1871328 RepID=UPI0026DB6C3B|nr:RNA-binding protein [Kocuria sp.]MDO4919666.1 RNA-binding protein [Kocuria sp.]